MQEPANATLSTPQKAPSLTVKVGSRLDSLDFFRGLTIAGMTLVNNPGSWSHIYGPLRHADWNGWTHTDLVFPFFLFIVGVSMAFSFAGRISRGDTRAHLLKHTLRRGAIIFLIGFVLNAYPTFDMATVRIPGVLQRIGICYAIAGVIYLYTSRRGRVIATAACLISYWAAMRFIPVPGYGAGNLTPGGDLGAYIDRVLMLGHLYKPTWDPEGLLSTIPAIATALLGTFAGELLRSTSTLHYKVKWLVIGGIAGIVAGYALNPFFPINKNIWTSSYVLFTAGYALLVLAACYWAVDVKQWSWAKKLAVPFLIFGINPILAYVLQSWMSENIYSIIKVTVDAGNKISLQSWMYESWFIPLFSDPRNSSLAFALTYVVFWLAVMWIFYKKRIIVKI